SRTELPIFYTFVVLYVSEHLFGMWGLIVGIPVFTFLLDILGVKSDHIRRDRKSTRLNSSHVSSSYAVFCLKKKKYNCNIDVTLSSYIRIISVRTFNEDLYLSIVCITTHL